MRRRVEITVTKTVRYDVLALDVDSENELLDIELGKAKGIVKDKDLSEYTTTISHKVSGRIVR